MPKTENPGNSGPNQCEYYCGSLLTGPLASPFVIPPSIFHHYIFTTARGIILKPKSDPLLPLLKPIVAYRAYKIMPPLPILPHFLLFPSLSSSTTLATLTFIFFKIGRHEKKNSPGIVLI